MEEKKIKNQSKISFYKDRIPLQENCDQKKPSPIVENASTPVSKFTFQSLKGFGCSCKEENERQQLTTPSHLFDLR